MMLLHIAGSNWDWTAVDSFEWNTFNVYDSIARCCVPIFVMISGMFFLNDDRIEPIGYIYKKRILRLVTAYLFWSTLYSLYVNLILQNDSGVEIKKTDCYRHCEWTLPFMVCPYDDRIIYGSTFFEKNMF
ncbi:Acyltransferase family [Roseburia intestinalis XB6B4]|uniref:Acyltransferase family n=2 Tax=Roseburia intestinalis TaxID=166486 RepID=D4L2H5_9FIRM|nr:Acyltransferase family [Roseburia intestinalis XB6B4]